MNAEQANSSTARYDDGARRLKAGVGVLLAARFLLAGGQALLVPLFLMQWGAERYGEWLSLSAVVAYASLADLGFSSYVVNRLNAQHARGETQLFTRTLHSAIDFSWKTSAAVLVVLVAVSGVLPLDRWIEFSTTNPDRIRWVLALLAVQVTASVPRGLLLGIYRAIGEFPRGAALGGTERLIHLGATAVVLMAGGDLMALALAQLLPLLWMSFWVLRDLKARHPEVLVGVSQRERGLARTWVAPSLLFLGVQAGMVLVLSGSTLLVGAQLGTAAVALFASLRTLANFIRQLTGSFSNALWPELTTIAARGENHVLRSVHRASVKLLWTLSICAAAFVHSLAPELFGFWTAGRLELDKGLLNAFLIQLVLQSPWVISSYVLLATNRCAELALRQGAAAVLGLGLGAFATAWFGATGLVCGLAVAEMLLCFGAVPRRVCRDFDDHWGDFRAKVMMPGIWISLGTIAVLGLCSATMENLPLAVRAPLAGLISIGLPAGLSFAIWLTPSERRRLLQAVPLRSAWRDSLLNRWCSPEVCVVTADLEAACEVGMQAADGAQLANDKTTDAEGQDVPFSQSPMSNKAVA